MESACGFMVMVILDFARGVSSRRSSSPWDLCPGCGCVFPALCAAPGPKEGEDALTSAVLHSQSTGSEQLGCPQCWNRAEIPAQELELVTLVWEGFPLWIKTIHRVLQCHENGCRLSVM